MAPAQTSRLNLKRLSLRLEFHADMFFAAFGCKFYLQLALPQIVAAFIGERVVAVRTANAEFELRRGFVRRADGVTA